MTTMITGKWESKEVVGKEDEMQTASENELIYFCVMNKEWIVVRLAKKRFVGVSKLLVLELANPASCNLIWPPSVYV